MAEQEVRGLEVSVKDPVVMEMMNCSEQLYEESLDLTWRSIGRYHSNRHTHTPTCADLARKAAAWFP